MQNTRKIMPVVVLDPIGIVEKKHFYEDDLPPGYENYIYNGVIYAINISGKIKLLTYEQFKDTEKVLNNAHRENSFFSWITLIIGIISTIASIAGIVGIFAKIEIIIYIAAACSVLDILVKLITGELKSLLSFIIIVGLAAVFGKFSFYSICVGVCIENFLMSIPVYIGVIAKAVKK